MSKLVVSIASWPPRINYVSACVKSLLDQTMPLDEINVNLSEVEFPNKEADLPAELQELAKRPDVCINWEEGNTFVFRKEVPVVKKYYGTDTIMISCDDDVNYGREFVERLVNNLGNHEAYNSEPGVVGFMQASRLNRFTPDFWEKLTHEIIRCGISDTWHWWYLNSIKADCKWGPRDQGILDLCHGTCTDVSPNSERIGGYTPERWTLANDLSKKALGIC